MLQPGNNQRTLKLGQTTRLNKQLSQGPHNFCPKVAASTKNITRMSENSLFPKTKTIMAVPSSRGGSIPKMAAKEAREFGREITQNGALAAV